jgi:hypothetical protein
MNDPTIKETNCFNKFKRSCTHHSNVGSLKQDGDVIFDKQGQYDNHPANKRHKCSGLSDESNNDQYLSEFERLALKRKSSQADSIFSENKEIKRLSLDNERYLPLKNDICQTLSGENKYRTDVQLVSRDETFSRTSASAASTANIDTITNPIPISATAAVAADFSLSSQLSDVRHFPRSSVYCMALVKHEPQPTLSEAILRSYLKEQYKNINENENKASTMSIE